jgi:hypothetical protein
LSHQAQDKSINTQLYHPVVTDCRIAGIDKLAQRELQVTVLSSKLTVRNLYHQKCIYLLNRLFDNRKNQCCVMHMHGKWIVWQFQYDSPYFQDDEFNLSDLFPVFANVYNVKVTTFGQQRFPKCDCLHYERCGIPCTHILKITDEIDNDQSTASEGLSSSLWGP